MDIDWSKAPEGATHRMPNGCWYKIEAGFVWCWSTRSEWSGPYPIKQYQDGSMDDMVKRPRNAEPWTGEGLPPVGTVCEFKSTQNEGPHTYEPVEIMYVSKVTVVVKRLDENRGTEKELICHPGTAKFRPVRTPEQIAAEEKNRVINEMIEGLEPFEAMAPLAVCEWLFDKGYRKFEIVEGE